MRLDTTRTYGLLLVCTLVLLKGVKASEGLSTPRKTALVRPYTRVDTLVHLHVIWLRKSLSTPCKIALVRSFACVGTLVPSIGCLLSEALSTPCNIALVRPFIRVGTPVHLQGIASFKSLSTKIALITLFACAGTVVVDLKAFLQREGLPKPRNKGRLDGVSNIRP